MAKFQSPLLGFNNNVRHRGRVFHIQTEDSGVNHPHVITHLFMDGGRILKSVKKSYAEHVGSDGMNETVRVLMKEQHKAMFTALKDGQFDALVDPKKGSSPKVAAAVVAPPPQAETTPVLPRPPESDLEARINAQLEAAEAAEADDDGWGPPPAADPIEAAPPPPTQPEPPPAPPEELPPNTIDERSRPPRTPTLAPAPFTPDLSLVPDPVAPVAAVAAEPFALEVSPNTIPERPIPSERETEVRRPAAELTVDFDALERDSSANVSAMFTPNDLPPPPKNLFPRERGTGAYSTVEAHEEDTRAPARPSARPSALPPRKSIPPRKSYPPVRRDDRREDSGSFRYAENASGRYAAARPANIFGSTMKPAAPPPPAASIFGDDLVSDKSLDEVILSYLAEDLDPKR